MPLNSFSEVIAPIEEQMICTVARMIRDPEEAADVMQEIRAAAWKHREKIVRHANPQGYVMRICMNKAYDALRRLKRKGRREISLEEVLQAGAELAAVSPEAEVSEDHGALIQSVLGRIAELPARQGQAVLLRLVSECSFKEIAVALGCAEATAHSHYSKGKARLRKLLTTDRKKGDN